MNDNTLHDQPLPLKAEHMPPTAARQARTTGHLRYMLAASVVLAVIALAIIYFSFA